jgi:hypothetical protein
MPITSKKTINSGESVNVPLWRSSPINVKQARLIPTAIPQVVKIEIMGSLMIGLSILAVYGEISAISSSGNP